MTMPSLRRPGVTMKTISNALLREWLKTAEAKGHDPRDLLYACGIPGICYENPRARISGEQLDRLNVEIRRRLDDQFLGYGREALSPALLDRVLIKILAQAQNLKELLLEWETFYNLVQGSGSIASAVNGEEFLYRFRFKRSQQAG